MTGFMLPSGSELGFFTQSDGVTIKTLELSEPYFDENEQGAVEFSRVVTEMNDEDGVVLDQYTTNFLYLIQVHETYSVLDSMAIKLREELDCPLVKRFWEKRNSPEAFKRRNCNATHTDFRWSETGPTKTQKFKDKGVIILAKGPKKVVVPFIGLILPQAVSFHELSKNIVLANPGGVDDSTMNEVLVGINKNIWYDQLHFIKQRRNNERLEIENAANAARLVSTPSNLGQTPKARGKTHREAKLSASLPSEEVSAARHQNLDKVMHGRVENGRTKVSKVSKNKLHNGSTPPYISRPSSASEASIEAPRPNLSPSAFSRTWAGRDKDRNRALKSTNDKGKHTSKRKGEQKDTRKKK